MQVSFAFLTGIALAVWWAAFVTIVIKTRPRIDATAAAPANLAIIEPPAVAALLYSAKGVVPAGAASATFLDLVARGVFRFERDPHGGMRVVGGPPDSTLRRYERLVYDHVVQCLRKTPSSAAEDLLQLERHPQSEMGTFRDDVLADARGRGLVRDRTPRLLRVVLWLALLVPAVFALGALAQVNPPIFPDVVVVLIGYRIATLPVRVLRNAVPTPAGARLAAAYRILQGHLDETADAHPPGDRLAAYSVALGAAASDRAIWSTTTGHWRRVRIVDSPAPVNRFLVPVGIMCLVGLLSGVLAALIGIDSIALMSFGVAYVSVMGMQLGFGVLMIYEKVYGLTREAIVVTGRVVYLGEESDESDIDVALDDGRSAQADVYKVGLDLFRRLHYGDWLKLELTPVLREIKVASIVGSERRELLSGAN